MNFIPQINEFLRAFALLSDHRGLVHQQPVVFHQAAVHRRWGFDFLNDSPMFRHLRHEPAIEQVIEPQRVIRVGAGIPHRFRIIRRQFIEIPARRHILERRQFIAQQFRHHRLRPQSERLRKVNGSLRVSCAAAMVS